jgi:hypothetical protein
VKRKRKSHLELAEGLAALAKEGRSSIPFAEHAASVRIARRRPERKNTTASALIGLYCASQVGKTEILDERTLAGLPL